MKTIPIFLFISVTLFLFACGGNGGGGDDGGGGGQASGCQWHGNCSTTAPDGAYDCSGNSVMQCNNGTWKQIVYCGGTRNSKGYACTCKGGCGTSTVECSYAFDICQGHEYETCGPNATRQLLDGKYQCVPG